MFQSLTPFSLTSQTCLRQTLHLSANCLQSLVNFDDFDEVIVKLSPQMMNLLCIYYITMRCMLVIHPSLASLSQCRFVITKSKVKEKNVHSNRDFHLDLSFTCGQFFFRSKRLEQCPFLRVLQKPPLCRKVPLFLCNRCPF